MANITSTSVFKNEYYIPLAVDTISGSVNTSSPNNAQSLLNCITIVERSILLNALGLATYNELQLALADLPNADQKWKDLVNGVEYDGKVWEGLINPNGLLVAVIYYEFLTKVSQGFFTAVGVSKPNSENSQLTTPAYKIASAWQQFIKKYQGGYMACPDISIVGGVEFIDWFGDSEEIDVSLYQFLLDRKSDYSFDESKFKVYNGDVNSFGI